jgi:hypothetical protein
MFKRPLLLGIISGLLASIVSIIYQRVYASALGTDFATIAKPVNIIISSTIGCIIAAIGYWLFDKWFKAKGEIIFNFVFVILSFASILPAIAVKLPLTVDTPELFPGLVVPMHFFPALAWFTLKPLFIKPRLSV